MKSETSTFSTEYTKIAQFHLQPDDKQIRIGRISNPRLCRYCGLDEGRTTFKKPAHAIPAFVGNRILISIDECDRCNEQFGKTIENDFGRYLLPLRALTRLKGKLRFPSTIGGVSDIRSRAGRVQITPNAEDALEIDRVNQIMTIRTTRQPYTPSGVFKCLAKMAVAILPEEELPHCSSTATGLLEPVHSRNKPFDIPMLAFQTFFPGRSRKSIILQLWKRRGDDSRRPCLVFYIFFHNVLFQIALPCIHGLGEGNRIDYRFIDPRELFENSDTLDTLSLEVLDLNTPNIVGGEVATLQMDYQTKSGKDSRT